MVLCALAGAAIAGLWVISGDSAPISMTVRGFKAKQWSAEVVPRMGSSGYLIATLELTNASKKPITYWAFYEAKHVTYTVLRHTPIGWRSKGPAGFCGTGLKEFELAPSRAVSFDAVVDLDEPCRIEVGYSDRQRRSGLWQRLPRWLVQRVPWGEGKVVRSDTIHLPSSVVEAVKRPLPALQQPEELPALEAAAEDGDKEAQFRLAGRYLTGNGLDKSVSEALRWYEAAAVNGHAEAAYNLGAIHEHGVGTSPDRAQAIEWYRRASQAGSAEAVGRLRSLMGE